MKLLNTDSHSRTLIVADLPENTMGGPTKLGGLDDKLSVTIGYVGGSSCYKGAALDGVVVPRIIKTFNNYDTLVAKLKEIQLDLADGTVCENVAKHISVEIAQLLAKIG
jgi:hypothetical protein